MMKMFPKINLLIFKIDELLIICLQLMLAINSLMKYLGEGNKHF